MYQIFYGQQELEIIDILIKITRNKQQRRNIGIAFINF